ncbi:MAG TPA: hypothetical protein VHG92_07775 [Afifellaceae bacterium]|nr:hypothetical protein [Afifellaceae bacterium]
MMRSGFGLLLAVGGLIVWASAFVVLYSVDSLGCVYGWHQPELAGINLLTMLLAAIWLIHIVALVWLQWSGLARWRRIRGDGENGPALYLAALAALIAAVSLVGTVYLGAPILILPPCA